jgi:general stress protein 26
MEGYFDQSIDDPGLMILSEIVDSEQIKLGVEEGDRSSYFGSVGE